MEKLLKFDKQGRVYIPESMRKKLKARSLVAKMSGNSLVLEPSQEDPFDSLSKLGKSKLKGKSIKKLKKESRKEIEDEAGKKVR